MIRISYASVVAAMSLILYLGACVFFRRTRAEKLSRDIRVHLIFPEDEILYDMYRPLGILDEIDGHYR